ncbi:MAG: hypothetical protein KF681_00125 [Bdellovibrionaceae bacterium]|nr:hypothetical protein [Pseudobdellovibrionaceae bacterium]
MEQINQFSDLLNLEVGKRYTVIVENDMGFGVNAVQFTFHSSKLGRFAQYENAVELIFTPKKKRNLHSIKFYGKKDFALFEGWVDVNTDAFSAPEDQGIIVVRRMKYSSCDSRFMDDAIASVKATPLFVKRFRTN